MVTSRISNCACVCPIAHAYVASENEQKAQIQTNAILKSLLSYEENSK